MTILGQNNYVDQMQKIHALRDEIGLDTQHYRDMLYRLTGSYSARYMTPAQRGRCIAFMEANKAVREAQKALDAAYKVFCEYIEPQAETIKKLIYLNGKFEAEMHTSLEDVLLTMRTLLGQEVKLVNILEEKQPSIIHGLSLYFELPKLTVVGQ